MGQRSRRAAMLVGFAVAMVGSNVGAGQTYTWFGTSNRNPFNVDRAALAKFALAMAGSRKRWPSNRVRVP